MRTFLNGILAFIGSESLTDEEFDALDGDLVQEYNQANYEALKAVLEGREGMSSELRRLKAYFQARGLNLWSTRARTPASQILIGTALD